MSGSTDRTWLDLTCHSFIFFITYCLYIPLIVPSLPPHCTLLPVTADPSLLSTDPSLWTASEPEAAVQVRTAYYSTVHYSICLEVTWSQHVYSNIKSVIFIFIVSRDEPEWDWMYRVSLPCCVVQYSTVQCSTVQQISSSVLASLCCPLHCNASHYGLLRNLMNRVRDA